MGHDETSKHAFTVQELVRVLGKSRQAVRKALDGVPHSAKVQVGKQFANGWLFADLPLKIRDELNTAARTGNYRDGESMLLHLRIARGWQPEIPVREWAGEDLKAAQRLQRALLPSLQSLHAPLASDEFERAGIQNYRREFGHEIAPRTFRDLLAETLRRDGGKEDWSNLEIFAPARLKRPMPRPAAATTEADLSALTSHISLCANPLQPTGTELAGIWAKAFDEFERLIAEGWAEDDAGRAVRDVLAAAPCFARTDRNALRMQFHRKWERRKSTGDTKASALRDRREDNGEPLIVSAEDRDALISVAARNYRGQLAPAIRDLVHPDGASVRFGARQKTFRFSAALAKRYAHVLHTRGYTPRALAEVCGEKAWLYYMHGLDKLDEHTSSTRRNWNALPALRCYSADDLTPCVYFYVPDGHGWFRLVRGQLLVFEDLSSGMILGYSLHPEPQYNSLIIRSLCTHVFAKYGVPFGLLFENGIWRKSKLLKGSKSETLTHAELTRGLEELGTRFTHTKHPWSKPIEKSFDLLQTLMQREPGYCGREEKYDCPPELKRAKELVSRKTNPVHPKEFGIYSFDEWKARIGDLCEQYNRTEQHGARCDGFTPAEACELRLLRNPEGKPIPNVTFAPEFRHLLSQHREWRKVRASGIEFQFAGQVFRYRGPEIAHLIGHTLETGFDSENPEMLTVKEPDTGLVIGVGLDESAHPAEKLFCPESDVLARDQARVQGQVAELRTYFKALDCPFELPARGYYRADAITLENTRRYHDERARVREQKRQRHEADEFSRSIGVRVDADSLRDVSREEMKNAVEFVSTPTETPASAPKEYVLKSAPAPGNLKQLRAVFWQTWKAVEQAAPGTNRFAITHKALGRVVPFNDMGAEQLAQCIEVFSAIAREHQKETV